MTGLDVRRVETYPDHEGLPEPYRRSSWGEGPWQDEPDLVEWRKPGSALPRLVARSAMGTWCGYVGVPEGHPLHGANPYEPDVDVHGGLNYGSPCTEDVCHVPGPGEAANVHWLGFDCAHALRDLIPQMPAGLRGLLPGAVYRDLSYVVDEVEALAEQLEGYPAKVLEQEPDCLKEQPAEPD